MVIHTHLCMFMVIRKGKKDAHAAHNEELETLIYYFEQICCFAPSMHTFVCVICVECGRRHFYVKRKCRQEFVMLGCAYIR